MQWIKISSWHRILTPTRMFDTYRTRCGRTVVGTPVQDLPLGEKSSETCLRLVAADADRAD